MVMLYHGSSGLNSSQGLFLTAPLKSIKWFFSGKLLVSGLDSNFICFVFWPQTTMAYALKPLRRGHFLGLKIIYFGLIFKRPCHSKFKSVAFTTLFCWLPPDFA